MMGRIIKVSQEVLRYREWISRKWGAKHDGKLENSGNKIQILLFIKRVPW